MVWKLGRTSSICVYVFFCLFLLKLTHYSRETLHSPLAREDHAAISHTQPALSQQGFDVLQIRVVGLMLEHGHEGGIEGGLGSREVVLIAVVGDGFGLE